MMNDIALVKLGYGDFVNEHQLACDENSWVSLTTKIKTKTL
jgi:hypothetical protein